MPWPDTVDRSDLRIEFLRGSGAGGQHRNKRDTACRITHKPTGISVLAQDSRSQDDNRRQAFARLARKLAPMMLPKTEAQRSARTVRTYHKPDNRVVDHRLPGERFNYNRVLNGKDLQDIIERVRMKEGS